MHLSDVLSLIFLSGLGGMTLVFGLSLRSGQKPIITRYAESMDGVLNYAENQYTRKVTWLWVGLLGALFALNVLMLFSPDRTLPVWLTPISLAGLLVGEYWVRPYFITIRQPRTLTGFLWQIIRTPLPRIIRKGR